MSDTGKDLHNKLIQDMNNTETEIRIEGICIEMCPSEEATLREQEKQVHMLEVTKSGHQLVKSYNWITAAGWDVAAPHLLRPFHVLVSTVHYLVIEVPLRPDVTKQVLYDFLHDRLAAVRQDMTIQKLPPEECVVLLEPMIRFYVYFATMLCEQPISLYDPVLNKKYLLECTEWFLDCCDLLHKPEKIPDDIDVRAGNLYSFDISETWPELSCDRILVESLYILCYLGYQIPLYRYLSLPDYVKKASALKLAYDIAIANLQGNFIRVQKLAKRLCPLTFSALVLHRPTIQRSGLRAMSYGFDNEHHGFPVPVLRDWLYFENLLEVKDTCAHYGLKEHDERNEIIFSDSFTENEEHKANIYSQAKIVGLELEEVMSYYIS